MHFVRLGVINERYPVSEGLSALRVALVTVYRAVRDTQNNGSVRD
jgi:hypothetical protein